MKYSVIFSSRRLVIDEDSHSIILKRLSYNAPDKVVQVLHYDDGKIRDVWVNVEQILYTEEYEEE